MVFQCVEHVLKAFFVSWRCLEWKNQACGIICVIHATKKHSFTFPGLDLLLQACHDDALQFWLAWSGTCKHNVYSIHAHRASLLLLPGKLPGNVGGRRKNMSNVSRTESPCLKNKTRCLLKNSRLLKTYTVTKTNNNSPLQTKTRKTIPFTEQTRFLRNV